MTPEIAELENVADFVKTAGIKLHVLPAHENPFRTVVKDQDSAFHYSCKLINEQEDWFVVYFSKGFGLRTWIQPPEEFIAASSPLHVPLGKIGKQYDGPMPPFNENTPKVDIETFRKCGKPTLPTLEEILNCLANDCRTIEQSQVNFTAWCKLLDTTDDSRFAKTTWDMVIKQRQQLFTLLGEGSVHRLIHETEPLK